MAARLRQLALVAGSLEPVVEELCAVLGVEVSFRDPGVATFGLCNAVMPVGDTFLEVVSPTRADASAARFLARQGGDGGYMVILQVEDLEAQRKRMKDLGVRIVWELALEDIATLHLHPRDVGGAILSLDEADPPESWRWAGPRWAGSGAEAQRRTGRVGRIAAAELRSSDPAALARRWSEIVGQPVVEAAGRLEIPLESGCLRFAPAPDGRGEGLRAIELEATDPGAACAAARERGLPCGDDWVEIGGVRFELTDPRPSPQGVYQMGDV